MNRHSQGALKQSGGRGAANDKLGMLLVFGSALIWSFGGVIARYLSVDDSWTVVFWRSAWAALFLLAFMLVRDGPKGTMMLFRGMGLAGVASAPDPLRSRGAGGLLPLNRQGEGERRWHHAGEG